MDLVTNTIIIMHPEQNFNLAIRSGETKGRTPGGSAKSEGQVQSQADEKSAKEKQH